MLPLILIALSLSIDALGVGFAYGLREIRIPAASKLLMSLLSVVCAFAAVGAGKLLYTILPPRLGSWISILILIGLGIYMLLSAFREMRAPDQPSPAQEKPRQYRFAVDFLGLTVTIIRHPVKGDLDHSKTIDLREAAYIGLALSLDSLGAGIGYSMTPSSTMLFPLFVGLFQLGLVTAGGLFGRRLKTQKWLNETVLSFVPGIIMLGLAFGRIAGI